MFIEDNKWKFEELQYDGMGNPSGRDLEINGLRYYLKDDAAALCHSILLLVDAINDKKIK